MKERPIIFSADMVRAILEGRKTQTRRVVKGLGSKLGDEYMTELSNGELVETVTLCPYGQPGDRLWVRETWRPCQTPTHGDSMCVEFAASDYCMAGHLTTLNRTSWKPSIHMPRWASRIALEIVNLRVERVQDVSDADIEAEGVTVKHDTVPPCGCIDIPNRGRVYSTALGCFAKLWDSINAKRGYDWSSNPWVWVIEFKQVTA